MLSVYFGSLPEEVYNTSVYFDNQFEDSWITSDISRKIIEDIDKSKVIDANCIASPVLGGIAPTMLSNGTKTLILMLYDNGIFNLSTCGDNCVPWILKIGEMKDIKVCLHHTMDFRDKTFNIKVLNNGEIVHNMKQFMGCSFKYI